MEEKIVLDVKHISGGYWTKNFFQRKNNYKEILHDISFKICSGETVGLIGESGAGKSTLAKIILGLIKPAGGEIVNYTKHPQMIFQDPYSSLNPAYTIERILEEPLIINRCEKGERKQIIYDMIERVALVKSCLKLKPKELSGGQLQRVNIAMALIQKPKFIIGDEPVSSLDLANQLQILTLLSQIQKEFSISYLFISHDLNVVYKTCTRAIVMKDGRILEEGKVEDIFCCPKHEYTKQLIDFM